MLEGTEIINIGTNAKWKELKLGPFLTPEEGNQFTHLPREFTDDFAQSNNKILESMERSLTIRSIISICEAYYADYPSNETRIGFENKRRGTKIIKCQLGNGLLLSLRVASNVLMPRKDGYVCMCVDFQDLNKASPKDEFPPPHIDFLVNNIGVSLPTIVHWWPWMVLLAITK